MANKLDNEVVLEATQGMVIFRDFPTEVDKLHFYFYATNPNGVVTAPIGSLVAGASGAWINTDGVTAWALLSTSFTPIFTAPNEYYIDTSEISQPARRVYPSIALAVAAAQSEQTGPYLLRLHEGEAHSWDSGNGLPAGSADDISIYAIDPNTTLDLRGTFPDGVVGATLHLQGLAVTVGAALNLGNDRQLLLDDVTFNGAGFTVTLRGLGLVARDSVWSNVKLLSPGGGTISVAQFTRCILGWSEPTIAAGSTFLRDINTLIVDNSNVQARADNWNFLTNGIAANTFGFFVNTTFEMDQHGAAGAVAFVVGGGNIHFQGTPFVWNYSGGGTINFGAGVASGVVALTSTGTNPTNLPSGSWYNLANDIVAIP